ncbi:carboxylesterase/lipase family protein [Tunturibacter empetritectus]|uniref:Carboxylic ester hydrolase n=1 Tax=Tunturiibacter empetritectus TaxID=3069691 RepID=A0A7W8MRR1_9BACT|nr:carboxylesterase family protein [Edaphobacter lichenicola]MBB5317080.1 para-nitrobenzyl esterase [Edaphobacter lichenicola]
MNIQHTFVPFKRASILLATAFLFLPCTMKSQTVNTESGPVTGATADGVISYKGIPYAAPPVGELRWRAPQPPAKWSAPLPATAYGHDCMQLPFPSDAAPLGTPPAEDCLVINVWAPANHSAKKLPVMFWIYGGGWVNGGSSPAVYDGSQFASGGAVLVSFNYRLGRLGFFAHPALTKEHPDEALGNYGYMDQIAALKWVQRNIAAFGGDPGNVTIFGESAGGFSVHMLMTTKLSDGLFQRAIVESGGGRNGLNTPYLHTVSPSGRPSAESIGLAFAKKNGIEGEDAAALEKLRALPAEAIVDNMNMANMNAEAATYSGPVIDGTIMRGEVGAMYAAGMQHSVPIIVGANSMDIGFSPAKNKQELFAFFGPNAKAAQQTYDPDGTANFQALVFAVGGDQFMIEPARFIARKVADAGQPAYEFRFSYVAGSMRKEWLGAPHASEIPYVFDTVKPRYEKDLTDSDEKIARNTNAYWINFAKTGNPNGPGLPKWPAYQTKTDQLMNFTNDGPKGMADPWKARLDLAEPTSK